MRKLFVVVAVFVLAALGFGLWYSHGQHGSMLDQRLAQCGAIPNGTTKTVDATQRLFINLPKDIYPDVHLTVSPRGATVSYVSNAGPYGEALDAKNKPNCWSYYFQFNLTPDNQNPSGVVNISSQSAVRGVPDYMVRFFVTKNASSSGTSTPTTPQKGTLSGTILLGPTCPVERIPPDPGCADKPYETPVTITSAEDPSRIVFVHSDASGRFSAALPPGEYTVHAGGSEMLPRCSDVSAVVRARATSTVSISCDTGIR